MTARRRVLCTRELCVSFALGPAPPDARLETERQNRPWERRTWPFANQTSRGRTGRAGMATAKAGSLGPAGPCWAPWLCGVCVTRQPARDGEDVAPVTPAILRGSILGTGGGMWGVVWKGDFLRTVA